MIFLETYGVIGQSLQSLADAGVFDYVLPFLLIFAIIYGLISKIKMFEDNRAVPLIIGLAIGALALVNGMVPAFFHEIFPRVGVALSILITALIMMGIFVPLKGENGKWGWGNFIFGGLGLILFFVVVISSLSSYNLVDMWWWQQYWAAIVAGIVVIGAIAFIAALGGKGNQQPQPGG